MRQTSVGKPVGKLSQNVRQKLRFSCRITQNKLTKTKIKIKNLRDPCRTRSFFYNNLTYI